MTRRIVVTGVQVLAAQGLIELADRGVGEVDEKIRAIAAGRWIRGTEDDYEVVYEDQPA